MFDVFKRVMMLLNISFNFPWFLYEIIGVLTAGEVSKISSVNAVNEMEIINKGFICTENTGKGCDRQSMVVYLRM